MKNRALVKTKILISAVLLLSFALTACGKTDSVDNGLQNNSDAAEETTSPSADKASPSGGSSSGNSSESSSASGYEFASQIKIEYSDFDLKGESDINECTEIVFSGASAQIIGIGAEFKNGVLTITQEGAYCLSGVLTDGQIVVNAPGDAKIQLLLDNVQVSSSDSSPLDIEKADKVALILKSGSSNILSDNRSASDYDSESGDDEYPNAAVYSKCSLNITGGGSLSVSGSYNHCICTKKNLKIMDGSISVTSANAGIKGKNSVVIGGGSININSGGDGIKTSEEENSAKGYIYIEKGTVNINSLQDGIAASLYLAVCGGEINVTTTGKVTSSTLNNFGGPQNRTASSSSASTDEASSKALKAGTDIYISGGKISLNSTDHSLHSSGSLTVDGGEISIASSSGKGISAHGNVTVNEGTIDIKKSTEGIESKGILTINGGNIHVVSSDDGLNAGGNTKNLEIVINGGYLFINASGDGIDSNGALTINGGTTLVAGPTSSGNGAIDASEGTKKIIGGILIAYGSAGMVEYPGTSSTQNVVSITFDFSVSAGEIISIVDSRGNSILTLKTAKSMQNIVFSSPELKTGEKYTVYRQGISSGEETDGLYTGGSYSPGTEVTVFTVSGIVTTSGSSAGKGGMGGGPPGFR